MGQSKLPAVCFECDVVGPQRPKAIAEGWLRIWSPDKRPRWLCPVHAAEHHKRERQRAMELREQSMLARRRAVQALLAIGADSIRDR